MKNRKKKTFIFRGLGFPIKLINVPMRKMVGEWVLDIDFEKLERAVLECLIRKPAVLNGDELKFIRKFLNMTTVDFGKIFGVSHVAVVKWEHGKTQVSLSTDVCIRLYVLDHLNVKDKEFRKVYHEVNPEALAKTKDQKSHLITIDDFASLKIA